MERPENPSPDESFLEPDNEERPADEPSIEEESPESGDVGERPDVPPGGGLRPTPPG